MASAATNTYASPSCSAPTDGAAAAASSAAPLLRGTAATCRTCGAVGHRTERCVAHLMPNVILAAPSAKKHRLEQHFEWWKREADQRAAAAATASTTTTAAATAQASSMEWAGSIGLEVLPSQREAELIFLRSPTPSYLARCIQRSPVLSRHFDSLLVCDKWVETSLEGVAARALQFCDELAQVAPAEGGAPPCVLRLQSYPKALRRELLDCIPSRVPMHPRDYTHVLCVVRAYKKYFVGIESRDLLDSPPEAHPHNKDDILSRAFHKLAEVFLIDQPLHQNIKPGGRAIDIGSSPGGWSAYLASNRGCHVLSIDPGEVRCSSPLVQHVPKLVEHSLEEVRSFTAEAPLDLIVCDMNVRPLAAADLIRLVCQAATSLSPSAMLVLTCKETAVGRSKMLVADAMAGLADWFGDFRSVHLLSNGKERTLVGHLRLLTPEEREKVRVEKAAEQRARMEEWERTLAERKAHQASKVDPAVAST